MSNNEKLPEAVLNLPAVLLSFPAKCNVLFSPLRHPTIISLACKTSCPKIYCCTSLCPCYVLCLKTSFSRKILFYAENTLPPSVCVGGHKYNAMVHVWNSEDNIWEMLLSYFICSRYRPMSLHSCPLRHLVGP